MDEDTTPDTNTGWELGGIPRDPFANIPGAYDEDTFQVPAPKPVAKASTLDLAGVTTLADLGPYRFEAEKRWFVATHTGGDVAAVEREMVAIYERAQQLTSPTSFVGLAVLDCLAHWRAAVNSHRDARRAA